ncbi:MAG TPA: hypothetical protein VHT02_00050 [Methylocella sp.]|jgi:hypothetical protein|nr:hypothetical protein [Methylocella sp.]
MGHAPGFKTTLMEPSRKVLYEGLSPIAPAWQQREPGAVVPDSGLNIEVPVSIDYVSGALARRGSLSALNTTMA